MKTIHFTLILFFLLFSNLAFSQQNNVGINTTSPDPSAALEVVSKNNNQGILIPKLTSGQRTSITSPANGLMVYDTDTKSFWYYNGFWTNMKFSILEDTDGDTYVHPFNTTGDDAINFQIDGNLRWQMKGYRLHSFAPSGNLMVGRDAGEVNTGSGNTFLGSFTGEKNLTGTNNTFVGNNAGKENTTGASNVAVGKSAGGSNTDGDQNVSIGNFSGDNLTSGDNNTFLGYNAGSSITMGSNNLIFGNNVSIPSSTSNKLYINNPIFADPLVYGEFDNKLFRINGTLNINNAFSFPITDGTSNQVLTTDGSGSLSWTTPATGSIPTKIEDADMDTSVETVEGTAGATDEVNVNLDGSTKWKFIGDRLEADNISGNLFVGQVTGKDNTSGSGNTFLGNGSAFKNTTGSSNTFVGNNSGDSNTTGDANVFVGQNAGTGNTIGIKNTFLGRYAGLDNTEGDQNIFVGYSSGDNITTGDNNLFLGNDIDLGGNVSNKLAIENNHFPGNAPLIYGEFDNDLVQINGTLNINDAFSLPTSDGTSNQVLATNGSGSLTWVTPASNSIPTKIEDEDTSVEVFDLGGTSGSNHITFKIDNVSKWQIIGDRFLPSNPTGSLSTNTMIGGIGTSGYTSTGTHNTFLGFSNGGNNTTGENNVFIGSNSGRENTQGGNNVYVGGAAGANNITGSGNVFLGNQGGINETGSNKLYIENSPSISPLIYGEFDNDLLRVNGTLNINNAFSFPTTDGTANQILTTDGSGNLSWTTSSGGGSSSKIEDSDMDTYVETIDGVGNTDIINFQIDNTLQWTMKEDRIEEVNAEANIFIGKESGHLNNPMFAIQNTFVGSGAGQINTTGANNTFIGKNAGRSNGHGRENTFLGTQAGESELDGIGNVYLGFDAGKVNASGNDNFIAGTAAASTLTSGDRNVIIGSSAGNLTSGSGNVIIGPQAWFAPPSSTANDLLIIENSDSPIPLIYGDFAFDLVGINRVATTNTLEVEGEASKTTAGSWIGNSDARLKKNIQELNSEEILQKLLQLQGVNYEWNDTQTGTKRPEGKQYGFIAQNIQKVFPELVTEDNLGFLQTAYGTYDAMQIEALRALLNRIENLENENTLLKTQLSEIEIIKAEIAELKGIAKN